nr:hypothetical protein [Planctomycetota bacterium]
MTEPSPHPDLDEALAAAAATLVAEGADTASVLEHAPRAIRLAGGDDRETVVAMVDELRLLAAELHQRSASVWSAFRFAVPAVATCCAGEPAAFL